MNSCLLRPATKADAPTMTEILNHYITNSTTTFLMEPQTVEERVAWFEQRSELHPAIAAEIDGALIGWGALSVHNPRPGYRHTADVSVYVRPDLHRRGIGRALGTELIAHARAVGHHTLIANCCSESTASIALHESLGFRRVGELREVGRKFDRWLDVVYLQLPLITMKRLAYHLVDVFTDRAFGGNPLAVFTDGAAVPEELMQPIAKELNLSETTFVLPPRDAANDFRVRIFTPAAELPMAGHPTVGTAFILAREGLVRLGTQSVTFEEGVGPIPVSIAWKNDVPDFIEMRQLRPDFGPRFEDVATIAEMLSLDPSAIRLTNLPIQVVSCGLPYLIVPVVDLAAICRIRFRVDVWERALRDFSQNVLVFTREVEFPGSHIHSRMFAPGLGVLEDPATGSASGPLGCYLIRHRVLASDGELRCVNEQGIEMGRPSFLHIAITHAGEEITSVRVGGTCHYMGAGHLEIDSSGLSS